MSRLEKETDYALENLDYQPYRDRIGEIESELHGLRDELVDAEKESLQDQGYKPINIDDVVVMVPVGMTLRQLRTSLKQLPSPEQQRGNKIMKQLVDDEDLEKAYESDKYREVVDKRQEMIDEVMEIYQEFWDEEVKPIAQDDPEKISFMLAGIGKNIRARKLSTITGVSEMKCKRYSLVEGTVEVQDGY
jgi:anion-transporting  ArsA/GET3 family ATPase